MSNKITVGWLHDNDGNTFAPKTLASQVQTSEGVLVEDMVNELNAKVTEVKSDAEESSKVLSARMDTFTALEDGSTSGDAELADIRIGFDGTTYNTAGEAVRSQVSKLSEEIDDTKKYIAPQVIMVEPDGFNWKNSPIHGKILTDYKGKVVVDYDVSKNAVTGKIYYVDRVNGSDSNDGLTEQTPLKTMTAAYNKSDIAVMKLTNGVYDMSRTLRGITIKKDLSIIGMGDEVYITSHSDSVFSKTDSYENVYQSNRGLITGVVDMNIKDIYNDWLQYEQVSTIDRVEEVTGSYAHIGGVVYIHTVDNRVPDDNLLLFAGGSNIAMSGGHTLYLENLKVIEGTNPLLVTDDGGGTHPKVFCKNCTFAYTPYQSGDAVSLQGVEIAIFQNCTVKHAKKDGFNYHALNGVIPKAIEIRCTAYGCGYSTDNDDQGSTIHDGGKIIRVNGNYFDNRSGNIADESEGTQSWNIGCVSHDSNGGSGGYNTNFFCYPGVEMWLDNCIGFGSEINCYVSEGGKIYTRFNRFSGAVSYPTQTERIVEY